MTDQFRLAEALRRLRQYGAAPLRNGKIQLPEFPAWLQGILMGLLFAIAIFGDAILVWL